MEATLNYKEKCWIESLDMVNNNLMKMYSSQSEFEGTLNSIGKRQNDLIKQVAMLMEWSTFNKGEERSKSKQPKLQIPEFSLSATTYKFEHVNMNHPSRYERRRK